MSLEASSQQASRRNKLEMGFGEGWVGFTVAGRKGKACQSERQ